ncbi:MAG: DUF551 domain-containing protein [Aeromonadaceae bacterium]
MAWIDVGDTVPTVKTGYMRSDVVVVKCKDGTEYETTYSRVNGFMDYEITHWMPLPPSP